MSSGNLDDLMYMRRDGKFVLRPQMRCMHYETCSNTHLDLGASHLLDGISLRQVYLRAKISSYARASKAGLPSCDWLHSRNLRDTRVDLVWQLVTSERPALALESFAEVCFLPS